MLEFIMHGKYTRYTATVSGLLVLIISFASAQEVDFSDQIIITTEAEAAMCVI